MVLSVTQKIIKILKRSSTEYRLGPRTYLLRYVNIRSFLLAKELFPEKTKIKTSL